MSWRDLVEEIRLQPLQTHTDTKKKESLTGTSGNGHANVSIHESLAPGRDSGLFGSVEVVTSRKGAAAGWEARLVRELFDQKRGCLVDGGSGRLGSCGVLVGHDGHSIDFDSLGRR